MRSIVHWPHAAGSHTLKGCECDVVFGADDGKSRRTSAQLHALVFIARSKQRIDYYEGIDLGIPQRIQNCFKRKSAEVDQLATSPFHRREVTTCRAGEGASWQANHNRSPSLDTLRHRPIWYGERTAEW